MLSHVSLLPCRGPSLSTLELDTAHLSDKSCPYTALLLFVLSIPFFCITLDSGCCWVFVIISF